MSKRPSLASVQAEARQALANGSKEPGALTPIETHGYSIKEVLPMAETLPNTCSNCLAWKPKPNQAHPIFGGCARSGKSTTHYGDTVYIHYTTDLQCCSAWEPK